MIPTSALILAVPVAATGGIGGFLAGPQGQLLFYGVVMVAVMYFFILRPQQRRAREHAEKTGGIKRGDQVILASGVIGKVVRVEDSEIGLEIAQNVTVKVVKSMIAEVRPRGEPAAANDAKPS